MTQETKRVSDNRLIANALKSLKAQSIKLSHATPTDEYLADAVGVTREIERLLQTTRLRWERLTAEMERVPRAQADESEQRRVAPTRAGRPVAVGKQYELVPKYKTNRTYNTPAILVEVGEHVEGGVTDALMSAIGADAVRLQWQWTNLKRFVSDIGGILRVGGDEVNDHSGLDAAMVGEQRVQSGVDRVPLKDV